MGERKKRQRVVRRHVYFGLDHPTLLAFDPNYLYF